MSLTVHLVRHCPQPGVHDHLCGRVLDDSLDNEGRRTAAHLGAGLAQGIAPVRIETSPRKRTRETAAAIADATEAPVTVVDALDEIDFGEWAGLSFAELEDDVRWRFWNAARDRACSPGGETMFDAIARARGHIGSLASEARDDAVICVTHADIIRGLVAHYLGLGLDRIFNMQVDPGSVTTVVVDGDRGRVASLNRCYS